MLKDLLDDEQKEKNKLDLQVKDLFNKKKILSEQNTDLQTQIQHISSKSIIQVKRVRQLEAINSSLEKRLKEIEGSDFSSEM